MENQSPRVALIGHGYWGKNLARVFHGLGCLEIVCETREETRREIESLYGVRTTADYVAVLEDPTILAVAIAAPAVQHYELAKQALLKGKDVYVEKPLALHASEGRDLGEIASREGRVLMVGHILEYHPAILKLKQWVREGELGRVQYIYSSRLNLGKLRTEENILWSFAPHDISAICSLLEEVPESVSSQGGSYITPNVFDTTMTTCRFRSGVNAHIFVSWLHPFKEQKLVIVGSKRMAVFNDVEPDRKLVLLSHQIDWRARVPVTSKCAEEVVELEKVEPLKTECSHFIECVKDRLNPYTDAKNGVQVLEVLEACEQSLLEGGKPVNLEDMGQKCQYFVHSTAVVDLPSEIGEGTRIWHFSHVMPNAKIGKNCNLGQNVVVSPNVIIGDNVKIQNNVSIYTGVILEDDVFCGPSTVFTNVINPRSHITRRNEYKNTLVRQGATLGANSTIVCGTTIGEYAFVAAGAVVAKDVQSYALVAGVPAKRIGWMCYCGVRLRGRSDIQTCTSCGRRFTISDEECELTEMSTATK